MAMEDMLEVIAEAYRWLWQNTTGRPFTDMMREEPLLFALPAILILGVTAWKLPRKYWSRVVLLYLGLSIGLVGGHVFW